MAKYTAVISRRVAFGPGLDEAADEKVGDLPLTAAPASVKLARS